MKIPFENRIFDHAFHHQLNDYDAAECQTCGKPENHHEWTTTFGGPEVEGTFSCPLCGLSIPHQHTGEEIAEFRNPRKRPYYVEIGERR